MESPAPPLLSCPAKAGHPVTTERLGGYWIARLRGRWGRKAQTKDHRAPVSRKRGGQRKIQDQGWMRFFRTETGPLDLWANARLIGGPPMRPAARRATTQQAGRTT